VSGVPRLLRSSGIRAVSSPQTIGPSPDHAKLHVNSKLESEQSLAQQAVALGIS